MMHVLYSKFLRNFSKFKCCKLLGTQAPTRMTAVLTKCSSACADVYLVPMFSDNYGYILVDRSSKLAAVVDPGEPQPVAEALKNVDCELDMLLCTHKHGDHAGGNEFFLENVPNLRSVGTQYEEVPGLNILVGEGDKVQLGALTISVIHAPCHTTGHIIFIVSGPTGSPIIFSGDTLFVGGCGRFFEGTAEQMLRNMDRLSQYPPESLVFCAHEYTLSNYKFLASVSPQICGGKFSEVAAARNRGEPTVPSTIGEEMKFNLFMRCHDEDLQRLMGCSGPEETMGKLRESKNNFK